MEIILLLLCILAAITISILIINIIQYIEEQLKWKMRNRKEWKEMKYKGDNHGVIVYTEYNEYGHLCFVVFIHHKSNHKIDKIEIPIEKIRGMIK
jgi:hypothetical protein